jgi:hypothetical protein
MTVETLSKSCIHICSHLHLIFDPCIVMLNEMHDGNNYVCTFKYSLFVAKASISNLCSDVVLNCLINL